MKPNQVYQFYRYLYISRRRGFTLLEGLIVVALIAIVMAIAAPSWLGWMNARRVNAARQEVYEAIRLSQQKASQQRTRWQFSLREQNDQLAWAIHPESVAPQDYPSWKPLPSAVELDHTNSTLPQAGNVYFVRFKFTGDVHYRLGRITFTSRHGGIKRCVIVSTLIGALRKGEEHPTPDSNGRYCY